MRFLVFLLTCLCLRVACAQERVAPPTIAFAEAVSGEACDIAELSAIEPEVELRRYKQQALQSLAVRSGGLIDVGGSGLSSGFLDLSLGTGIPLGSFDNILGVTPRFQVDWIDANPQIDIPNQLYQFELQFFYRRPINERLSAMAVFSPAIRSDLTTSDSAFRVFGLALLNWQCLGKELVVTAGAVYLGRADLPVLPAVGLTWTPNRRTKVEARFPFSRISRRLKKNGRLSETWSYLSVGLGGNTWAVTRRNSQTDELSLRDLRLTLGLEKIVDGGGGWFAEGGFAFSRRLEYERDNTEVGLNDAAVLQAGWRY